jgi:hypothetical protein
MMMATPTGADAAEGFDYFQTCDGEYTVTTVTSIPRGFWLTRAQGEATEDVTAAGIEFRHGLDLVMGFQANGEPGLAFTEGVPALCWEAEEFLPKVETPRSALAPAVSSETAPSAPEAFAPDTSTELSDKLLMRRLRVL